MTHLTLLPSGRTVYPSLRVGESYHFLREDSVAGYIFIEVGGKPLCVSAKHFAPAGGPQPDGSYVLDCSGNQRFEREG